MFYVIVVVVLGALTLMGFNTDALTVTDLPAP